MLLIKKQLKWEPRNKTKKMAGIYPVTAILNVSGLSDAVKGKSYQIVFLFFKIQLYDVYF